MTAKRKKRISSLGLNKRWIAALAHPVTFTSDGHALIPPIIFVEDLKPLTRRDLLHIRGIGPKAVHALAGLFAPEGDVRMPQHTINTRKGLARIAAERWKEQYWTVERGWPRGGLAGSQDPETIYRQIIEAEGDPDKIDAIIGNNTWTRMWCGACGKSTDVSFLFGHDYDSVIVCLDCLNAALEDYRAGLH